MGIASAAETSTRTERPTALTGLLSCLECLRSGSLTANWRKTPEISADFFVIFDFDADCFRFDVNYTPSGRRIQEVRKADERIVHVLGSMVIQRQPPGDDQSISGAVPMDPRLIGLISQPEFERGKTLQWFKDFIGSELTAPEVSDEGKGILQLRWDKIEERDFDGEKYLSLYRRTTWIDANKGFAPFRTEIWTGGGKKATDNLKRRSVTDAEWVKRDDVWIPSGCTMRLEAPVVKEEKLSLSWQAVNAPVHGAAFTPEGLSATPGTLVSNKKAGPPVIEGKIGAPTVDDIKTESGRQSNIWLWCVGSAIGLVAIASLARRRAIAARTGPNSTR